MEMVVMMGMDWDSGVFVSGHCWHEGGEVKQPNGGQHGQAQQEGDEHLLQVKHRLEGAHTKQQQQGAFKDQL